MPGVTASSHRDLANAMLEVVLPVAGTFRLDERAIELDVCHTQHLSPRMSGCRLVVVVMKIQLADELGIVLEVRADPSDK